MFDARCLTRDRLKGDCSTGQRKGASAEVSSGKSGFAEDASWRLPRSRRTPLSFKDQGEPDAGTLVLQGLRGGLELHALDQPTLEKSRGHT